ncbi:MAG: hypothetical protein ACRCS8_03730 [Brevinema sp.]
MAQNMEARFYQHIIAMLLNEGYHVFQAPVKGEGADLIVRNINEDQTPSYIELQVLSRREEYVNPIAVPVKPDQKNHFAYFILYSSGMQKIWLLSAEELISLREEGLDDRDTSPYLVKNFDRLKSPELSLSEFKKLAK